MKATPQTWIRGLRRIIRPSFASLFIVVGMARGADSASPQAELRPLNLPDCLKLALEHNLDLQIERKNTKIVEAALYGSYGAYDPAFRLGVSQSREDVPSRLDVSKNTPTLGAPHEKYDTTLLNGGIVGKLPSGGTYDIGTSYSRTKAWSDLNTFVFADFYRTNNYIGGTALNLSQPLLRNFWIDSDRLQIQVNKKQLKVTDMAVLSRIMLVVHDVLRAYADLLHVQESVAVWEDAHNHALRLLKDVKSRIQAGTLPALEERLFAFAVESLQADLDQARQMLQPAQSALRNLISSDLQDWIHAAPVAQGTLSDVEEHFNQVEAWREAMTRRPEIRQMQLDLEKRDIVLRYSRNQLYPSLDLVGSLGLSGISSSVGNAYDKVANGSHSSYSYGAVMNVPLSNRSARGALRAARETKEQALLQLKKLEMDILTGVETAGRAMVSSYKQINSRRQAIQFAQQVVESEEAKIRLAQTSSFNATEARKRLTGAKLAHLKALLDYNQARTANSYSQGKILDQQSISVDFK
ncbi:MAG: TolC family protein [Verrucomicrobia bacterium]|nr:TolC family protein [Verrucomicrobiota bacterium]